MGKSKLALTKSTTTLLIIIIFTASLISLIYPIFKNRSKLSERFNEKTYEKKYNNSQYVIPQSKHPISDEELLSYAGYKYAKGLNPVLINSDHPPLGKYLIGWFTLLTGNSHVVSLVFAIGNIFLLTFLVYFLTNSYLLSSIAFLFLSSDSVFLDQIIYSPVLDIIQVFFFLVYIWIYLIWSIKKKNILLVPLGIALGAIASVKLYFPAFILLFITGIHLFALKKSLKTVFIVTTAIFVLACTTFALSYFNYFAHGNSLRNFLGTQKWIFLFWKNNSIQVAKYYGAVIPFILFNQWKVWWGNKQYINFEHWTIFWPLFFVLGTISVAYFFLKFKKNYFYGFSSFLALWIFVFTIYLCFIPISPRYLMLLYFPIYILITLFLNKKYDGFFQN